MSQSFYNPENPQWQNNAPNPYEKQQGGIDPTQLAPRSNPYAGQQGGIDPTQLAPRSNPYEKQYTAYGGQNAGIDPTQLASAGSPPPPPAYSMPGPYAPANQYMAYPGTTNQPRQGDGQAVAGLVLGIIGLIAWLIPFFGYPVSIVGIIMAALGRRSVSRHGMATVGLVLAIIALVLTFISSVYGVMHALG